MLRHESRLASCPTQIATLPEPPILAPTCRLSHKHVYLSLSRELFPSLTHDNSCLELPIFIKIYSYSFFSTLSPTTPSRPAEAMCKASVSASRFMLWSVQTHCLSTPECTNFNPSATRCHALPSPLPCKSKLLCSSASLLCDWTSSLLCQNPFSLQSSSPWTYVPCARQRLSTHPNCRNSVRPPSLVRPVPTTFQTPARADVSRTQPSLLSLIWPSTGILQQVLPLRPDNRQCRL